MAADAADAARASERAAVWAATLAVGALVAQQIAGKATRDALFLGTFDVRRLPFMMAASSLLAAVAVLAFSQLMARHGPGRVVPAAIGCAGLLLLAEWGLAWLSLPAAAAVFFLHMSFFGAVLASGVWSLFNERFDPHAARRHVGRIGMGASIGGVLGGLLATAAARVLAPAAMLALLACLSLFALVAVRGLARGAASPAGAATPARLGLAGVGALRGSPYLRSLALFVAAAAVAEALLEYQLASSVVAGGRPRAELMGFFGAYQTSVACLALLLQAALARRSLESIGLGGTAALKPAALVATGLAGTLAPGLAAAVAARGSYAALHNSLFRSAYELLYTPLPAERKRPTKALVDVGADKLGAAAGGLLAAAVVWLLPGSSARVLFGLSLLLGLGLLLGCRRLYAGYVESLAESLRSGAVQLDPEDVVDSTTLYTLTRATLTHEQEALLKRLAAGRRQRDESGETLTLGFAPDRLLRRIAALRSHDVAAVRAALDAEAAAEPALVGHVIPLLARNDVFLEALRYLRHAAPAATGQLVDALLDGRRPLAERRRLPRVLKEAATQRAADGLLEALAAPEFELRYECAAALERITAKNPRLGVPKGALHAAALRELDAWPARPDAETLARRLEHLYDLLAPAHERLPLRLALHALRGDGRLRGTALEYLDNVLPELLRDRLSAVLQLDAPRATSRRDPQELRRELVGAGALPAPPVLEGD